jgi:hypothetical protein
MPILIKTIQGQYYPENLGTTTLLRQISGEIQFEDYINLYSFTAYLQNFQRIEETTLLNKPLSMGLKNQYNISTITLDIDY